jgi:hypothetical protein
MNNQSEIDNRKTVLKKDVLFACSMLAIYTICFIIFVTGTSLWVREDRKIMNANATSTAAVIATQQANVTSTAIVRATEQARYEFVDPFNENMGWLVFSYNNGYFVGSSSINEGVYAWDIREVKETFVYWADSNRGTRIKDFDVYVDTKIVGSTLGDTCSGLFFRMSSDGWWNGAYIFSVCNNSFFNVYYHKQDEWESISDRKYSDAIRSDDWNRLEITAQGNHFVFLINNIVVYEMTDDRKEYGRVGLYIEINETYPASILFDNFGLQRR